MMGLIKAMSRPIRGVSFSRDEVQIVLRVPCNRLAGPHQDEGVLPC
jgi:hypothetical protein